MVETLETGEVFGDLGLFNITPHTVNAVCAEACALLVIRRTDFKKLLLDNPEITFNQIKEKLGI